MTRGENVGEHGEQLDDVRSRLEQIKRRHRGGIRWHITERTAELAIAALQRAEREEKRRRGGKIKRRKPRKRLL